jgi:hypothetical protein
MAVAAATSSDWSRPCPRTFRLCSLCHATREKARRVESAGFLSIFSRYEIRDLQCLINIANPLITRYRLNRLACPAIRCHAGAEVARRFATPQGSKLNL